MKFVQNTDTFLCVQINKPFQKMHNSPKPTVQLLFIMENCVCHFKSWMCSYFFMHSLHILWKIKKCSPLQQSKRKIYAFFTKKITHSQNFTYEPGSQACDKLHVCNILTSCCVYICMYGYKMVCISMHEYLLAPRKV